MSQMVSERWVLIENDVGMVGDQDHHHHHHQESETEAYYRALMISLLEDPAVDNHQQVYDSQRLQFLIKSLEAEISVNGATVHESHQQRNHLPMAYTVGPSYRDDFVGQSQTQVLCPPPNAGGLSNFANWNDDYHQMSGLDSFLVEGENCSRISHNNGIDQMAEHQSYYGEGFWDASQQTCYPSYV